MRHVSQREYDAMSDYERGEYEEACDNEYRERKIEAHLEEKQTKQERSAKKEYAVRLLQEIQLEHLNIGTSIATYGYKKGEECKWWTVTFNIYEHDITYNFTDVDTFDKINNKLTSVRKLLNKFENEDE